MSPVPEPFQKIVDRYWERQWHIMALLARCPGADDLAQSTPALAFALASNWVFAKKPVKQPMRTSRALCRKRQRDICGWLGFPTNKSTLNALRKLPTRFVSIMSLLQLRSALRDESGWKMLRHAERINPTAIRIAANPHLHGYFTRNYMSELLQLGTDSASLETLGDVWSWLSVSRLQERGDRRFNSVEEHQAFVRERREQFPLFPKRFATELKPPEGNEEIVLLDTNDLLIEEAREMQHCVASYWEAVRSGNSAIYRVLSPIRATLELRRNGDGWFLNEIKGDRNKNLHSDLSNIVKYWLKSNNIQHQIIIGKDRDRNP